MSLAWHIEALARQKKMPRLQRLLSRRRREQQNPDQQQAAFDALVRAFGAEIH